jgi:hypothetical protein
VLRARDLPETPARKGGNACCDLPESSKRLLCPNCASDWLETSTVSPKAQGLVSQPSSHGIMGTIAILIRSYIHVDLEGIKGERERASQPQTVP